MRQPPVADLPAMMALESPKFEQRRCLPAKRTVTMVLPLKLTSKLLSARSWSVFKKP